jgi:hypothetical protein
MGAITPEERAAVRGRSPVSGKYDTPVNRESAAEKLAAREQAQAADAPPVQAPAGGAPRGKAAGAEPEASRSRLDEFLWGTKRRQGAIETAAKQATRTVASGIGRQILRGVLGGIFGKK